MFLVPNALNSRASARKFFVMHLEMSFALVVVFLPGHAVSEGAESRVLLSGLPFSAQAGNCSSLEHTSALCFWRCFMLPTRCVCSSSETKPNEVYFPGPTKCSCLRRCSMIPKNPFPWAACQLAAPPGAFCS